MISLLCRMGRGPDGNGWSCNRCRVTLLSKSSTRANRASTARKVSVEQGLAGSVLVGRPVRQPAGWGAEWGGFMVSSQVHETPAEHSPCLQMAVFAHLRQHLPQTQPSLSPALPFGS